MSAVGPPGETAFVSGETSFLAGVRPQDALRIPFEQVLDLLRRRLGAAVDLAVSEEAVDLSRPLDEMPGPVRSPRASDGDPSWIRTTNMVGVNVRTVDDYAGVVKYALTLPEAMDSIHLLPVWEPGVVESLYGIASWNLNGEFFSEEMYQTVPRLDTIGRQLRAVSNLLHVMGKTVGMDVIPHTDRFSEAAVGTPDLFEWMRVSGGRIIDHSESLTGFVEAAVHGWLLERGSASPGKRPPPEPEALFSSPESERLQVLFGDPSDLDGRTGRRVDLVRHLKGLGLEPVPATMGVPFRGIEVDLNTPPTVDDYGMTWHEYRITHAGPMSRVFTPLARFKLYGRLDDNANWEVDFSAPRHQVWDYVCTHYAEAQHIGNFDFMRGDMSHVQMRPDGVPVVIDERYDILGAVKTHIQRSGEIPWFGYLAESFLAARDVFGYGEELDHLEASQADTALGDLQSTVVGSPEYLRLFRRYLDDLSTRSCAPTFCIGTADKDDPRFDRLYTAGNEARLFTALFVPEMSSYVGLGFEIRDVHAEPVANERYTKLFVFKEDGDSNIYPSKARFGDGYIWGENIELFENVTRLRVYAESVLSEIAGSKTRWLVPPDATGLRATAAWTHDTGPAPARYVFVVNYSLDKDSGHFGIPGLDPNLTLIGDFSTVGRLDNRDRIAPSNGLFHRIENLAPGEARVYRVR